MHSFVDGTVVIGTFQKHNSDETKMAKLGLN